MIRTCLHCKAPFQIDDYGVMPNSSCNCGGCYATKEELKYAIAWAMAQIEKLQETLKEIELKEKDKGQKKRKQNISILEPKYIIAWHEKQIKALQETVETIEELRELLGTLECQDD